MSKRDHLIVEDLRRQANRMLVTGNREWCILVRKAANRLAQLEREAAKRSPPKQGKDT
jgi:hypothetical protein